MTLVSPDQSNPNDEITADAINGPVNQIAAVINGGIDSTNISSVSGAKLQAGTVAAAAMDTNANPETRTSESEGNFVASGLVWSIISGLNGTMTAGVAYITGKRLVVSSIASKTYTASKDTYVSVDINGSISYSEVANGAAAPSLPASSLWLAIVITSGASITAINLWGTGASGNVIYPDNGRSAWRSWTPTWTNVSGGSLTYAKYMQIGKTVYFTVKYTLAGAGVTGVITLSTPTTINSTYYAQFDSLLGNATFVDTGSARYMGVIAYNNSTTILARATNASGTYTTIVDTSSTVPFTFGNTDVISIIGSYEAP